MYSNLHNERNRIQFNEWRTKYPSLKQITYISFAIAKKMGLTRSKWDTRAKDSKVFRRYCHKPSPIGPCIKEIWISVASRKAQRLVNVAQKKKAASRNKRFIRRYKSIIGCTICGWKKSTWGLHFDHINPDTKRKGVAEMAFYSRETIKKEIRKCRLICANCHSVRTQQQRRKLDVTQ